MFKTIPELQQFLIWAKEQGIQQIKVGEIEVHFNALAFLPEEAIKEISGGASTLAETDTEQKQDDEEAEFWSSMP